MRKENAVFWCNHCGSPIITNEKNNACPNCNSPISFMAKDIRPVFPEERLLLEILIGEPLYYLKDSVWASKRRYFINGKPILKLILIGILIIIAMHLLKLTANN